MFPIGNTPIFTRQLKTHAEFVDISKMLSDAEDFTKIKNGMTGTPLSSIF